MKKQWIEIDFFELTNKITVGIRWNPRSGKVQLSSPELKKDWTEIDKLVYKKPSENLTEFIKLMLMFDFERLPIWLKALNSKEELEKNKERAYKWLTTINFRI